MFHAVDVLLVLTANESGVVPFPYTPFAIAMHQLLECWRLSLSICDMNSEVAFHTRIRGILSLLRLGLLLLCLAVTMDIPADLMS